ncbi:CRISPR-associated helicase/endonuclease Cas3 [Cetobacterium sp. ZOR0034]|uniref:CRISPR-associated helicase/endonuclease Cas3 n=1 Tax=Cetobacterium sp. ZOR0034 TaxID=1339239 RepID=UPI0006478F24|nr:CRISPR-associated helicase/endonuclease Cas3 [Cetobacterium sp. ZOR0034]
MNIQEILSRSLAKPLETIREHTDKVKSRAEELREMKYISENQYRLLELACEYHDYGKLNPEFQNRIKNKTKFNNEKEVGHNILSTYFIDKNKIEDREEYLKVLYAVLNHHFYTDNLQVLENEKKLCLDLLKDFEVQKITLKDIKQLKSNIDESFDVLTGLLNKCDYSGSGNYPIEYLNNFLLKSLEELSYSWNELQEYCIENRDENLIVIANTGMGKTEAGLLWIGNNKGFFILPLKTAINSIYKRVSQDLIKSEIEKRVVLLHSEAVDYLFSNTNDSYESIKNYIGEGKALSIPLTISTLDQIFNFVFLYPGHEVKLATLSYSKVVLDEIQAYSPDLLAYIVIGLKKIKDVGGKFAILTATLPPFIKDCIEKEIGSIKYEKFIKGDDRHNLKIENSEIDADFIYSHYAENGGKTLVVCNTVKKAQEIYKKLKEIGIRKEEIELLHSKYLKKDRLEKEKKILEFGKTEVIGNKIWISTSLVEASLDIDFDFLFTELNDLSGLFQRLGRVNRKGKKSVERTNAFVFTEINKNLFINGEKGFIDKDIFTLSKLALSEVDGILSEEEKYNLIEKYLTSDNLKKSSFMDKFNGDKNYMNQIWRGRFEKEEVAKRFRNIISYKCIPYKVYEEYQDIIDELVDKYETSEGVEREEARIELNMYTLGLGIYEKGKNATLKQLGREIVYFVDGEYSYELGFERAQKEKEEGISFDNFV